MSSWAGKKTHFCILISSLSPTHLAPGEALWVLSWCHAPQVPKNCIWTILHPPKYALVPGRSRRTCKYIISLYIDTFVQQLYAYICIHNSISTSNITYIHIHATFSAFPCKHPRISPINQSRSPKPHSLDLCNGKNQWTSIWSGQVITKMIRRLRQLQTTDWRRRWIDACHPLWSRHV